MSRRRTVIVLTDQERDDLRRLVRTGTHAARTITRAHILLLSATGGHTVASICATLDGCPATVYNIRSRYHAEGVAAAVTEKPRSGFPRRVTQVEAAQITSIACSTPASGRTRWTAQLVTDRLVTRYGTALSHESVRQVLKKVSSSPGRNATGV